MVPARVVTAGQAGVLAARQAGVVARAQLVAVGVSPRRIATAVSAGRWQRVLPGVYAVFTGPVPPLGRVWAAVLYAGAGAAASHGTALWLAGAEAEPSVIHVAVPSPRHVIAQAGIRIHRSRAIPGAVHPVRRPPRVRLEDAVLDILDGETAVESVLSLVFRICQGRFTTAGRLRQALAARSRHRWRTLLTEVLAEVDGGVASPLEQRYLGAVERAHGLPRGERNHPEEVPPALVRGAGLARSRRWYRDVRYRQWGVVIELDGRGAHPGWEAFRDRLRDNVVVVAGDVPLRYGWHEIVGDPCGVAAEVAAVLVARGWTGRLVACSPNCRLVVCAPDCRLVACSPDCRLPEQGAR
ncbi:MAG: type IV toxin-antitoxin system AbiEi family antitoxin domain-containing protein [Actinomycetales bacterium]|nr:type IV toxin-antitoxin system AbiEi family antitoxin domain-containing protein [Actinomycetales bacterium]